MLSFSWEFNQCFEFFLSDTSGVDILICDWDLYRNEFLSQFSIVDELFENGFALRSSGRYLVDSTIVLNLSIIDKQILSLPEEYKFEIYIQALGQLNQSSFSFKYGFYDFLPNGTRFNTSRNGPLLDFNQHTCLVSSDQFQICEAIDAFNGLPESSRTFINNLTRFADIKAFSVSAAVILDNYLAHENVLRPLKIKIDLEFLNGVLEVIPSVSEENSVGFTNIFDKFSTVKEVYPVKDASGNTTRIVIDDQQRDQLVKIKAVRSVSDKVLIKEIVDNPQNFFDDKFTDYSVFYSDRVKEIGVYRPSFYPFVCPYKSEWIPCISIEDKIDGPKTIGFPTLAILQNFSDEVDLHANKGEISFFWKESEILVSDAKEFVRIGRAQFENPSFPVPEIREKSADLVLIIKENGESLEYGLQIKLTQDLAHEFTGIRNLSEGISLKDHQIEGVSWLQMLNRGSFPGGLLADDMGLGKTLQLLYFIEWHSQQTSVNKPYLIIAPVSLLENWELEYQNFFPDRTLSIKTIGSNSELTKGFDAEKNITDAKTLQIKGIILVSYETLRVYQTTLGAIDYAVVALDEAQKIKTPGAQVTTVVKALKADFKIAMTGTPVENTLIDLWCIMDFVYPGLLGSAKEFAKVFHNPLKDEETDVKVLGEKLRQQIGIFIKRRMKKDVAKDLPIKFDNLDSRIKCVMPDIQLDRYKVEIELSSRSTLTGVEKRNQILKSVWAIRDISDHPYLADKQIQNYGAKELIDTSAKLRTAIDIVKKIKLKHEKVIIFADRRQTQKMIQRVVYELFGISPSIINGDTPTVRQDAGRVSMSRQQTVDHFQQNEGFNLIIMSPVAAGIGLNITKANHIIHYSRHWNPAKEEQATDRAYRIGQKKDVYVYYPMAIFPETMKNRNGAKIKSFDEVLDSLLERKRSLAGSTLFPTDQADVKVEELFGDVFGVESESSVIKLTMNDVDNLHPLLFEAFVSSLYSKLGYEVFLTPNSNDKGVDVVAIGDNGENFLFQVKQSKSLVGINAVQEVHTAKNYYESKFKTVFKSAIITNSNFTSSCEVLSRSNNIELVKRSHIERYLLHNEISIQDVKIHDSCRMATV